MSRDCSIAEYSVLLILCLFDKQSRQPYNNRNYFKIWSTKTTQLFIFSVFCHYSISMKSYLRSWFCFFSYSFSIWSLNVSHFIFKNDVCSGQRCHFTHMNHIEWKWRYIYSRDACIRVHVDLCIHVDLWFVVTILENDVHVLLLRKEQFIMAISTEHVSIHMPKYEVSNEIIYDEQY